MDSHALKGRSILVVEEEPHIARHLADRFRQAGATVFAAGKLLDARYLAEHPALSAAVINLRIGDDTTAGTDANIVPLTMHDFVVTPDGSDITAQIAAAGFYRAS